MVQAGCQTARFRIMLRGPVSVRRVCKEGGRHGQEDERSEVAMSAQLPCKLLNSVCVSAMRARGQCARCWYGPGYGHGQ